jgi:trans-aconitate methyltransferase
MPAHGHSPSFSWNAADYHTSSYAQQQWAQELIAKLALCRNEHILDIGCGDGKVTAAIAGSAPRGAVVGVDSSSEMIQFARKHFPEISIFISCLLRWLQSQCNFSKNLISSSRVLHCTGWQITARCFQVLLAVCAPGEGLNPDGRQRERR